MRPDETFAELDRETLRELSQRRDGPGLRRLAVQLAVLIGTGALVLLAKSPAVVVGAVLLHGAVQATFFAPLHESLHRTAFATRWLNEVTSWLAGFVQFSGPAGYRAFHFTHHRHTHEIGADPELAGTELLARWPAGLFGVLNATGLPILIARVGWVVFSAVGVWPDGAWRTVMPFVSPDKRPRVTRDSRVILLGHLALVALAWFVWPALWRLYAAALVGHAVLSLYLSAEHRGLAQSGGVLDRTRSFGGSPLDLAMWNMPFHAEHHAWPGVPFFALPELHRRVRDRVPHRTSLLRLYLTRGRG